MEFLKLLITDHSSLNNLDIIVYIQRVTVIHHCNDEGRSKNLLLDSVSVQVSSHRVKEAFLCDSFSSTGIEFPCSLKVTLSDSIDRLNRKVIISKLRLRSRSFWYVHYNLTSKGLGKSLSCLRVRSENL